VFRYFLAWLEHEYKETYQEWLDTNIAAYVAVGAPLLGAPQAVEGILSGITFGLPRISPEMARDMASTFGTPAWSLPFRASDDEKDAWPIENLINITVDADWAKPQGMEEKFPRTKAYSSANILQALEDVAPLDSKINNTVSIINKYYLSDPVIKHFTPWSRPPIKKVICAYGVDMRTELAYHYSTDVLKGQWRIKDVVYEYKDKIYSEITGATYPQTDRASGKSGDGTVPYASLSWCHRWLGKQENAVVTKIPQRFYNRDDPNLDVLVPGEPLITFYESLNANERGDITAVWEFDGVEHRDVIRNRVFLREFAEELLHEHSGTYP